MLYITHKLGLHKFVVFLISYFFLNLKPLQIKIKIKIKIFKMNQIEKILQTLPLIQTKILLMHKELNGYLQTIKQNEIKEINEESIKEIQHKYELVSMIYQKNSELIPHSTTINELISQLALLNSELISYQHQNELYLNQQKQHYKTLHKQLISKQNNINEIKEIEEFIKEEKEKKQKKSDELHISIEELQMIESWTKKEMKEIIFDTEINDWEEEESEFDEIIMNKNQLLFLIEIEESNNKFGGYINNTINVLYNEDENKGIISDEISFVFKLKGKNSIHFPMKKECSENAFYLYPKEDRLLFKLGFNDIEIYKEDEDSFVYQENNSSFDYNNNSYALVGKKDYITPKRILVIQLI